MRFVNDLPHSMASTYKRERRNVNGVMIDESYYTRPEGLPEVLAAGDRILIAAAHEHDRDDPVLPKGHVDPGEDIEGAARREIAEEVGVRDLTLLGELGTLERMDFDKTEWKVTHYFLYLTRETNAVPLEADVHSTMSWVPLDPTPAFFWPEQRSLIDNHRERIGRLVREAASKEPHV